MKQWVLTNLALVKIILWHHCGNGNNHSHRHPKTKMHHLANWPYQSYLYSRIDVHVKITLPNRQPLLPWKDGKTYMQNLLQVLKWRGSDQSYWRYVQYVE